MFSFPNSRVVRLAFYGVAVVTTIAALSPSVPFKPSFDFSDKIEHFAIFAVLASLALFGFPQAPRRMIVERLSFFGAAIEVLQSIPALDRDCDVFDWAADTLGAAVAVLLLARLVPARRAPAG
ncbi:MAG: VanZ family protein [Novosphingobium sp.]|nr:VanZ family protein [Novosphingobium sp.]